MDCDQRSVPSACKPEELKGQTERLVTEWLSSFLPGDLVQLTCLHLQFPFFYYDLLPPTERGLRDKDGVRVPETAVWSETRISDWSQITMAFMQGQHSVRFPVKLKNYWYRLSGGPEAWGRRENCQLVPGARLMRDSDLIHLSGVFSLLDSEKTISYSGVWYLPTTCNWLPDYSILSKEGVEITAHLLSTEIRATLINYSQPLSEAEFSELNLPSLPTITGWL